MEIVDDAVAAHASAPRTGSPKALHIAMKGVLLHGQKRLLNALLIFWRQLSELFLGRAGEFEVPAHSGRSLMILNHRGERQLFPGEGRPARLSLAPPQDNGSRNKPAGLRVPAPIECAIPAAALPRIAAPWPAGAIRS